MIIVDTHCHIDFPQFEGNIEQLLQEAKASDVGYLVCVSVNLDDFPNCLRLAIEHDNIFASVGVHPNTQLKVEPSVSELVRLGSDARVIAVGETGLDYFRSSGDLDWQRDRFRTHIRAAQELGKPLIIHSREAPEDTISILSESNAASIGGIMHCFTGSYEMAKQALDLGFYISFSGIVTFKNARDLAEVAEKIPLDRILVETDAPYLAPVPFRGKLNQPAYVRHTAEFLANLRGLSLERFAEITTDNFFTLFGMTRH